MAHAVSGFLLYLSASMAVWAALYRTFLQRQKALSHDQRLGAKCSKTRAIRQIVSSKCVTMSDTSTNPKRPRRRFPPTTKRHR